VPSVSPLCDIERWFENAASPPKRARLYASFGAAEKLAATKLTKGKRNIGIPAEHLAPDAADRVGNQLQFGPLLVFAEQVALGRGGKATLRA